MMLRASACEVMWAPVWRVPAHEVRHARERHRTRFFIVLLFSSLVVYRKNVCFLLWSSVASRCLTGAMRPSQTLASRNNPRSGQGPRNDMRVAVEGYQSSSGPARGEMPVPESPGPPWTRPVILTVGRGVPHILCQSGRQALRGLADGVAELSKLVRLNHWPQSSYVFTTLGRPAARQRHALCFPDQTVRSSDAVAPSSCPLSPCPSPPATTGAS